MIENKKIIKTLELCITAIKAIHPILDADEPCIAYEATEEARKLIKELQAHNVAVAPDTTSLENFDFEMDATEATLCGKLGRKHKMKRINWSITKCIYPGCDGHC